MVDVTTETHDDRAERLGAIIKELSTFEYTTKEDGTIFAVCTMVAIGEAHLDTGFLEGQTLEELKDITESLMIERMALDLLISDAEDFTTKEKT